MRDSNINQGLAPTLEEVTEKLNRYTVELTNEELAVLKTLANEQGVTTNMALRRAIATENYMRGKLRRRFKVLLESPSKEIYEVSFK